MEERDGMEEERTTWPYATIFLLGYFGRESPGGRALAVRTTLLLALLVAAAIVAANPGVPSWLRIAAGATLPGTAVAMGVAYAAYLRGLDELSRALQLQAAAVAYVAAFVIMLAIYGFGIAFAGGAFGLDARVLLLLVVAEPVRAASLGWFASRYG